MIIRFLILLFVSLYASTVFAADIKLKWNPSTESDLAGYKVHHGAEHRVYTQVIDTGSTNSSYVVSGLPAGTYYLCVTAYDVVGNESDYSYEVVIDLKMSTVTGLVAE